MANKKSVRSYQQRENYIHGNTVRELYSVPERQPEGPGRKKKVSRNTKQNRERALQMNLGYVAFLTIAAIATVFVCIQYLKLQSEMTSRNKNIIALETELEELKSENDTVYQNVLDSVDLEYIKQVALDELGMIYAEQDQIVKYESKDDDYARQYEEVPKDGHVD